MAARRPIDRRIGAFEAWIANSVYGWEGGSPENGRVNDTAGAYPVVDEVTTSLTFALTLIRLDDPAKLQAEVFSLRLLESIHHLFV